MTGAISDPPRGNFGGSKWHQQTILDVSHPDPTKIHGAPVLWHFGALCGHKIGPKGEILMASNWISTQPDPTDEIKSLWSPIKHVAKQS